MVDSIFDPSWYRVAELKPRVRSHGEIHKHKYRDQSWFILQDHASNRFHRFTPEAYQLIKLMDGNRTIQQIIDIATEKLGDNAPTQTEAIQLLGQLHMADMLQCDITPDTGELLRRYQTQKKQKLKQTLRTPLAIRIPLYDPDRVLNKYLPYIKPVFSLAGFLVWLTIIVSALILAGFHWVDLTENISDRVLAPQNLLLLWLVFPLVKLVHEFGHGFSAKIWGGEIHEMGIMLLVFMPVPYVDASSASAFQDKRKRMIVGAAGMMVEMFIAAIAMLVWVNVEPGLISAISYNVMLIAGVSTLLFNGNPLLRFDGYYIFSDLVEIPNLATRANKYFMYLLQKYVYGVKHIDTPATSDGERHWFAFYAIASFVYRMLIYFTIIFFIAGKFFVVGILLALWALVSMFVIPLVKGLLYLFNSSQLSQNRSRAFAYSSAALFFIFLLLFVIPLPWHTVAEGVVWPAEKSTVRMGGAAFVEKLLVKQGEKVSRGQPLIICSDPLLSAEIRKKKYELMELVSQQRAFKQSDVVQVDIVDKEIQRVRSELNRAREKAAELVVRAPMKGKFYADRIDDLPGKYFAQGERIAFVLSGKIRTIRVVVPQDDVDIVRNATEYVEVRFMTNLNDVLDADIRREVPAASRELPSPGLSGIGGGGIAVDPREKNALKTFERVFQFDVELKELYEMDNLGSRAYVRFYHGFSPVSYRWYKSIKQLLLRKLNV